MLETDTAILSVPNSTRFTILESVLSPFEKWIAGHPDATTGEVDLLGEVRADVIATMLTAAETTSLDWEALARTGRLEFQ